jgi:hypothetical protein
MSNLVRILSPILGAVLFFGLAIWLLQPSPYNIFFWMLISLSSYFLIAHAVYTAIFFVAAYAAFVVISEGSLVDDADSFFNIKESEIKERAVASTIAFFGVLFVFTIIGYKLRIDFSYNCYSIFCQSSGKIGPDFTGIFYAMSGLCSVAFLLAFPVGMTLIGGAVGAAFPTFLAGIIALSQHNKFEAAIKRTLPLDRPDRAIERELAQIMRDNLVNEQQVEELISHLSPLNQWVRRIQYRKRLQDARRLREMAKAKYGALGEEADLALKIHDIEGSRRERDDWRQMR